MSSIPSTNTIGRGAPIGVTALSALSVLQRLLLGVVVLEIPIQIDTYLFYQEQWAEFGAIGGFNLSLTTICLAALYLTWMVEFATATGLPGRRRLWFSIPLTTYLTIVGVSFLMAENRLLALNSIALLGQSYLLYFYVSNRVRTKDDVVYLVALLLVALAIQGAIIIGLYAVGHDIHVGPIAATVGIDLRIGGTLGSPNGAASYLSLLIAPALAVLATSLPRGFKLLAMVAMVLGGFGVVLTLSRGGWIAVGLSTVLFCLLAWYRGRISGWLPLSLAFAVLVIGGIFHNSIIDRLVNDDQGSAQSRVALAESAWRMIADHPALGVGVNNSTVVGARYAMRPEYRQDWFYTTHNKYLLEWEELGVLGLGAFLWFLLSTLRTGWKSWRRRDTILSPIALGLAVAILGQMTHMLVDTFNDRPLIQALWLNAALLAAIYRVQEDD